MAAAIGLRGDFDTTALRALAKRTKDGPQARWLLALATIYDGATRSEVAKIGGVTLQIIRDWVMRFNTLGPEGLVDRKVPGQPPLLNEEQRAALARVVEDCPTPQIHGVVRWRITDLCQWLFEEFLICASETTESREPLKMGYRRLSARPRHHAQREAAIEDFKKVFPPLGGNRPRDRRRGARDRNPVFRRGACPPGEQDHSVLGKRRFASERAQGSAHRLDLHLRRDRKGVALGLPKCDTERWTSISRKSHTLRPACTPC